MAKYDEKTAKGWPLPHKENRLYDDVERLRETLNLIDEAVTRAENHEASIDTRLDTILQGATEDSEILDARVDAQDNVHPNLGHNIRNLHSLILDLYAGLRYAHSEFQGLLRQYDELVHSQINDSLNISEISNRRKEDIYLESLSRQEQDTGLQLQADILAWAKIKNALSRKRTRENLRARFAGERQSQTQALSAETQARIAKDNEISLNVQRNTDSISAEARTREAADDAFRSALNEERQAWLQADGEEIISRNEADNAIQRQADSLAFSALRKAVSQKKIREAARDNLKTDLFEVSQRILHDNDLQAQLDLLSDSIIQGAANLQEAITRRRDEIRREIIALSEYDAVLLKQIAIHSQAVSRNSLNIRKEAEKRRAFSAEARRLLQDRLIQCDYLQLQADGLAGAILDMGRNFQAQSDSNARANLNNSLKLKNEAEKRRQIFPAVNALVNERTEILSGKDSALQDQADLLAQSAVKLSSNVSRNASKIREINSRLSDLYSENERHSENDGLQQEQINLLITAIIQNAVSLHEAVNRIADSAKSQVQLFTEQKYGLMTRTDDIAHAHQRHILNTLAMNEKRKIQEAKERSIRYEQDGRLQEQIDQLAWAVMNLSVSEHETHKKVSSIETDITMIPGRAATDDEFDELLDDLYND